MLDSWEMLDFALLRDKVTLSNISISILTILLVQAASQVIYYRLFSPIKQFPGPFWGSVTRLVSPSEHPSLPILSSYIFCLHA